MDDGKLLGIGLSNDFLGLTTKAKTLNMWDYIKLNLLYNKGNHQNERQTANWKTFVNRISDMG